jgi:Concanavalin A-like lectin/glucanases superfamily/Secretion system C-terminal sorting domain
MKNLFTISLLLLISNILKAQSFAKSMGGTSADLGRAVATDAAGNVYTTGYFAATVDFDPGAGIANLTTAGVSDIFISKLDAGGNFVWAKKMGGTGTDVGYGITIDASGNVYTTGSYQSTADLDPGTGTANLTSAGGNDIFVSKLDAAGNFVWAKSMGGVGVDIAYGISVDASGNVYTTGYFTGTADLDPGAGTANLTAAGSNDIFISKLDVSGNFVWAKSIGGTSGDIAYGICVDGSGNVYTTGNYNSTVDFDPGAGIVILTSTGGNDIFISKLDAAGNFVWAKSMGGSNTDNAYVITVDASGNLYTAGYFTGAADFDPGPGTFNLTSAGSTDIFVSKLDVAGNFVWAKSMGGTSSDNANGISVDASGNVSTTGSFTGTVDFDPNASTVNLISTGATDIFISKLDAAGNFVWAKSMGGINNDIAYGISVDVSGNVYTTGYFAGTADFDPGAGTINLSSSAGSNDIFVSKLNALGQVNIAATALNFDGTNDYINCGNNPMFNLTASLSAEAWIKRSIAGTDDCIIGKDVFANGTGYALWVYQNNKFVLRFSNREYSSVSTVAANVWTHVAATYDATTTTLKLYINGILDATFTSVAVPVSNTGNLYIGTPQDAVANALFGFGGSMDEVRVWGRALQQSEIQNNMSCEMNPSGQTDLLMLYHFNQGAIAEANAMITAATDASGNSNTGTLTNFALTGTASNWVAGNATGNCNLAAGGLNFDGSNDYISVPHNTIFNAPNLTVQAWVKTAVNDAGSRGIVNKYYSSTGNGWNVFLMNGQVNAWYFGASSSVTNIVSSVIISDNAWHQVSFTIDNSGGKIFIDGVLTATQVWSAAPSATTTTQNMSVGLYPAVDQTMTFFNGSIDEVRYWNRALCQSEIQNSLNAELNPLLQTGLKGYYKLNQGFLNSTNTGITISRDHSGNNFAGTLNNFALAGATSNWVAGNVTGNAAAFAPAGLAGAAGGAQVCQSATIQTPGINYLDASCNLIAAVNPSGASPLTGTVNTCVKIDATVQTYNAQPYVQRHYDIEPVTNAATATGTVTLYFTQAEFDAYNAVRGAYPALPTGSADATGISKLLITQFHGTGTAPGNYSGSSIVINPADANIVWNGSLSRWQVTFDVSGFSGFYVHTSIVTGTLPVSQMHFTGSSNGNNKILEWSTANETNVSQYVIERSTDGSNFKDISTTNAKGNASNNYLYTDQYAVQGNVYYRLRIIEISGKISYSNIINLNSKVLTSVIYPNPVKDKTTLQINDGKLSGSRAKIIDAAGKTVFSFIIKNNFETVDMSLLPAGLYVLQTADGNNQKIIKR